MVSAFARWWLLDRILCDPIHEVDFCVIVRSSMHPFDAHEYVRNYIAEHSLISLACKPHIPFSFLVPFFSGAHKVRAVLVMRAPRLILAFWGIPMGEQGEHKL